MIGNITTTHRHLYPISIHVEDWSKLFELVSLLIINKHSFKYVGKNNAYDTQIFLPRKTRLLKSKTFVDVCYNHKGFRGQDFIQYYSEGLSFGWKTSREIPYKYYIGTKEDIFMYDDFIGLNSISLEDYKKQM